VREALGDGTLYLDKFREFIDNNKFFRRMVSLVEPREPLAVLCHGDCWTNNILFRYSEEGEILEVRNTD
jgi:fructosamine-3-kinase